MYKNDICTNVLDVLMIIQKYENIFYFFNKLVH